MQLAFGGRVPLMPLDDTARVPRERRRPATIVDLTGSVPRLVREGSVPAQELRAQLRERGLGELYAGADATRI